MDIPTLKPQIKPMLTIGVPVHNGGSHILKCLEYLSRQTYRNFQVVIFENQSTDNTLKLAQGFCQKDNRFSIVPSLSLLPALENFKRAYKHVSTESDFFTLRACDDYSSDNFMEVLCDTLIDNPDKQLAVSSVQLTNGTLNIPIHVNTAILNRELWGTFKRPFNKIQFPASWIYGVYRSNSIDKVLESFAHYPYAWAGDRLVVLNYLLNEKLIYAPSAIFFCMTGSDSYAIYSERETLKKVDRRVKYFKYLWSYRHTLKSGKAFSSLAYFMLCYKTSASDTTYTIENIIKSYLRRSKI